MESALKIVGQNIRYLREHNGMSQEELANKCGHNTPNARSWISQIENGRKNTPLDEVAKIAYALGVEPFVLFIEMEKPADPAERLLAYAEKFKK